MFPHNHNCCPSGHAHFDWNDTEHAYVVPPYCPCPDETGSSGNYVNVTSGDIENWNSAFEWYSVHSGVNLDNIDLWDSTYETVGSNSSRWESAYSGFVDISQISGDWNEAVYALNDASALLNTYGSYSSLYVDVTLSGNGTDNKPFGLSKFYYTRLNDAYKLVHELIKKLYGNNNNIIDPQYQQWIDLDDWSKFVDFSASTYEMDRTHNTQIEKLWKALQGISGDIYQQIINEIIAQNNYVIEYDENMNAFNASSYNETGKIYIVEGV